MLDVNLMYRKGNDFLDCDELERAGMRMAIGRSDYWENQPFAQM